ncbi:response regulator [Christensenella intestinihominis]|uniref:response regulator n=1 Tax=Christensenella intestinihominis TaxID=1851429 RepID=UPI0008334FBE|nr:response regulator [Christensenella intestinihominis]
MEREQFRVVIVDNDPMVSYISREYLARDRRFAVAGEFADGREALRFLRGGGADLVLLELRMPGYSGEELMKDLLENDIHADVIPVTAERSGESLGRALRLGAADYLIKPFTYERFRQCLERYAQRARIAAGLKTADQEAVDHLLHMAQAAAPPADAGSGREQRIMDCFRETPGRSLTVREVAQALKLSDVTVRRYLKRLVDAGRIVSDIDYNTGGHPRILYKLP